MDLARRRPPRPRTGPAESSAAGLRPARLGAEHRSWLVGALASVGLSLAGMTLVLRLWKADLSAPIAHGDAMFLQMMVRNMQVGGWPRSTPLLNVPLGQDLRGYPNSVGDLWNIVGLKLLSFVASPVQAINLAYLAGFVLVTLGAFAALVALRVSVRGAIPLAAVYSWLPYHFLRGEQHLFLSMYAAIPLACVAAVAVYRGGEGVRLPATRRGRLWLGVGVAALLGGTGVYYAAFALVLLAAAGVLRGLAQRTWRPLVPTAVGAAVVGAVALVPGIPSILFRLGGGISAVEGRSYAAAEFYGLKVVNLLLPLGHHRLGPFAELKAGTADSLIPGEGSETLGLLGVAGLIAVVLVALLPMTARGPLARGLQALGVLAVVSVVAATVAGLNGILALVGLANLRAWNRMSVVVAFLALAGLGLVLDATWRRWSGRVAVGVRPIAALAAMGAVSVVGLLDQTTDAMIPDYPRLAESWHADQAYFAEVQAMLGEDAEVFQLPVARFPENPPIVRMQDYDHLRGYLHSDLGWSYGGLKGGLAEWQQIAMHDGIEAALPKLVAAGFDAVYVNRTGYADQGAAVEMVLRGVAGPPVANQDDTLAVYDLRGYAAELTAAGQVPDRESVLYPLRVLLTAGAYPQESSAVESWQWVGVRSDGELVNPGDEPAGATLLATLRVAGPATVVVTVGDQVHELQVDSGEEELRMPLTVRPGTTPLSLTTDAAATPSSLDDTRDLRLQVVDLRVVAAD